MRQETTKTMRTRGECIDILQKHADDLKSQFGITSLRIFGSVARGENTEGSDVDVFVTMPPVFYNYVAAAHYLEQLLGCDVDLVRNHRNLRPFFRQQIERDGISVF